MSGYIVYGAETPSVFANPVDDIYGGAHAYTFRDCLGFEDGRTIYADTSQTIRFVKTVGDINEPGLQSEQLILALLDRTRKLNAVYPSIHNEVMINGLEMFLSGAKARIDDRINRGVMGQLKP